MSGRLDWFPCEPSKLLGALSAMKPHVGYVYWIVCLRIYEIGGPCPDTIDALSRRTGYTKRVISESLDELFQMEKLQRQTDGIMNPYASEVLSDMQDRHDASRARGFAGAKKRWQKTEQNQQNDDSHPMRLPLLADAHLHSTSTDSETKESLSPRRRRPRATMKENWRPDDHGILYAKSEGNFDAVKIEQMIRACRNYHLRRGTLIAGDVGLRATWRMWVDNEIKYESRRSQPKAKENWQQTRDDAESYLRRNRERAMNGHTTENTDRKAISGPSVS